MPTAERYARDKARAGARRTTPFRLRTERAAQRYPQASPGALAGHASPGERALSERAKADDWVVTVFADDPPRRLTLQTDLADAKRGGRYDADLRRLKEGRLTADRFQKRWRRAKPIGGHRLVSDPRAALALDATTAREDWVFESGSRPAQRRRRAR